MNTILVIDDEGSIREILSDILKDEGYQVVLAADGEEGQKKALLEDIDAVILDVLLPKKGGIEVLDYLHREFPVIPVILITGHGDIKMAVEAMKKGAFDFIEKPLAFERIVGAVRNAVKFKELSQENFNLKSIPEFIGAAPAVLNILSTVKEIAKSDASVLITGENGTGKEILARLIHRESLRKNQSFTGVNCAAIPETLIESELFGYERGAFTGAHKQKKGKFETASKGTLFLDEIGDLSLNAQAKVLRAIQEREVERVGGNVPVKVDVRIISATNKDLAEAIRNGKFRQDLYYRLNVVPITIPPLRNRKDDIPLLIDTFLKEFCNRSGKKIDLTKDSFKLLNSRDWPGNVRELRNFIERIVILAQKPILDAADLMRFSFPEQGISDIAELEWKEAKANFEKKLIVERLVKYGNNVSKAAESFGIERTHLHKKIKELGLSDNYDKEIPGGKE